MLLVEVEPDPIPVVLWAVTEAKEIGVPVEVVTFPVMTPEGWIVSWTFTLAVVWPATTVTPETMLKPPPPEAISW